MKKITRLVGASSLALLIFEASAQENTPLDSIYSCAVIEADLDRLACYDQAVGRAKEAQQAGEFQTITRQEAEEVQKDAFGFSLPSLPKFRLPSFGSDGDDIKRDDDGDISEIVLAIKEISTDRLGKVEIVFENGQVWYQADTKKIRVSRKRPPTEATIKRGSLGSFLIKLSTGESFKAKREK